MKGKPFSKFKKRAIDVPEVKIIAKNIAVENISLTPLKTKQKRAYDKQKDQGRKIELGKKLDFGNEVDLGCKLDLGY